MLMHLHPKAAAHRAAVQVHWCKAQLMGKPLLPLLGRKLSSSLCLATANATHSNQGTSSVPQGKQCGLQWENNTVHCCTWNEHVQRNPCACHPGWHLSATRKARRPRRSAYSQRPHQTLRTAPGSACRSAGNRAPKHHVVSPKPAFQWGTCALPMTHWATDLSAESLRASMSRQCLCPSGHIRPVNKKQIGKLRVSSLQHRGSQKVTLISTALQTRIQSQESLQQSLITKHVAETGVVLWLWH